MFAGDASAATISFDDGVNEQNGVLEHTAGGVVTGTSIDFDSIRGFNTPLNSALADALECRACELSFNSGALTEQGPDSWRWASGGTFVVNGDAVDSGNNVVASGILLDGVFGGATAERTGSNSLNFSSFGTDTKNGSLLEYFGVLGLSFEFSNTEISLGDATISGDGSFSALVDNADLDNFEQVPDVPEPATLALIGGGLLAAGGMAARRRRRAA